MRPFRRTRRARSGARGAHAVRPFRCMRCVLGGRGPPLPYCRTQVGRTSVVTMLTVELTASSRTSSRSRTETLGPPLDNATRPTVRSAAALERQRVPPLSVDMSFT